MDKESLTAIRSGIDRIDEEMVKLLIRRLQLVDQVAKWKMENRQPVSVPEREEEIIRKVSILAGENYAVEVAALYRELFSLTCARESRLMANSEGN